MSRPVFRLLILLAGIRCLLPAGFAWAGVSLKNGNFFISYTDIVYVGGLEPKIDRTYNSQSDYRGMFGFGWASNYETYLAVSPDGSATIHEHGGGDQTRFEAGVWDPEDLDRAVDRIYKASVEAGGALSPQQIMTYKKRLKEDSGFRADEWEKYVREGFLEPFRLSPGARLVSTKRGSFQYIEVRDEGYERVFKDGKREAFDGEGRLVRIYDRNGNFIALSYDENGHLKELKDHLDRRMAFTVSEAGLVEGIQGDNGKECIYEYSAEGQLIFSRDVDDHTYTHAYDPRHNMVEIGYTDGSKLSVRYYVTDNLVQSVTERSGSSTLYTYDRDPLQKDYTSTTVMRLSASGDTISTNQYEYFTRFKAGGEPWTHRMVTTENGVRTETVYNECCGLPVYIRKGDREAWFEYDARGNITKKVDPDAIVEFTYHPVVDKPVRVVHTSRQDTSQQTWTRFEYTEKGDLTFAENSAGTYVKLFYDERGKIATLEDENGQIHFKYNDIGKPTEIEHTAYGKITVTYTPEGAIEKVDSPSGQGVAVQVVSSFQNLLEVIRPAGVSLSLY